MGIPEVEESHQGNENLFEEIITENFSKSHQSRKLRESQISWTQKGVH